MFTHYLFGTALDAEARQTFLHRTLFRAAIA